VRFVTGHHHRRLLHDLRHSPSSKEMMEYDSPQDKLTANGGTWLTMVAKVSTVGVGTKQRPAVVATKERRPLARRVRRRQIAESHSSSPSSGLPRSPTPSHLRFPLPRGTTHRVRGTTRPTPHFPFAVSVANPPAHVDGRSAVTRVSWWETPEDVRKVDRSHMWAVLLGANAAIECDPTGGCR